MEPSHPPFYTTLLGPLVGVARATYNSPYPIQPAYHMMIELLSIMDTDFTGEQLAHWIQTLHDEKFRLTPDCATCGAPCGRTNDFDPHLLKQWAPDALPFKLNLLSGMSTLAKLSLTARESGASIDFVLPFFADGLFAFGEDWDADYLSTFLIELEEYTRQLSNQS